MRVVVAGSNVVTAYGWGMDALWSGLLENRTAISMITRFPVDAFSCKVAGTVPGLDSAAEPSIVMQMLKALFAGVEDFPEDVKLFVATTTGEMDLLERGIANGGDTAESRLLNLPGKICGLAGISERGQVVSSACASSTVAVALGASMIRAGEAECVLVTGCDCVSEFVFSGFASLRALDDGVARPFDAHRNGLNVGEAAGYAVLMSDAAAQKYGCPIAGEICGWGMSNDANHMTGPSRDGEGLARAIQLALQTGRVNADAVSAICAHGTGTMYNDSMEMKAFKQVFQDAMPTFSIKGGTGHTMGAAGLVELLVGLRVLDERAVPPTIGVQEVADDAAGWVRNVKTECAPGMVLTTNSGFGGVNAALLLNRYT